VRTRKFESRSPKSEFRIPVSGFRLLVSVFRFVAVFLPSAARAVCSYPAGKVGEIMYNKKNSRAPQYCNGVYWVGAGPYRSPILYFAD